MKKVILTYCVLALLGSSPVFAQDSGGNSQPDKWAEGNELRLLTENQKQEIAKYLETSLPLLGSALVKAKDKSFEDAYRIYVDAMKRVIQYSWEKKQHPELMMRIAINQGLLLAYGKPTETGEGISVPGVLVATGRIDLLTVILEDSIKMAIYYGKQVQEQLATPITEVVIGMPSYGRFAFFHLMLGRKWLGSVYLIGNSAVYDTSLVLMQQLLNVLNHPRHQQKMIFAEEIRTLDSDLIQIPKDQVHSIDEKNRIMRGHLEEIAQGLATKLFESKEVSRVDMENSGKCVDRWTIPE